MSEFSEGVNAVAPFALAGISIAGAFWTTRRTGREGRHHARVEALYQDILDSFEARFVSLQKTLGRSAYLIETPVRPADSYQLTFSRIRLYASPEVLDQWEKTTTLLTTLEVEAEPVADQPSPDGDYLRELTEQYHRANWELAEQMRRDLGVPRAFRRKLRLSRRRFAKWLVTKGIRRDPENRLGMPARYERVVSVRTDWSERDGK